MAGKSRVTAGDQQRNALLTLAHSRDRGEADSEIYRRFFYTFGTDVATAQTLGTGEAAELNARVFSDLATKGVHIP